jgi:hypothetical protein
VCDNRTKRSVWEKAEKAEKAEKRCASHTLEQRGRKSTDERKKANGDEMAV